MANTSLLATVKRLGPAFAARAAAADLEGRFVRDNYAALKEARVMSALVPADLGGGGATHAEVCQALRELARHCGSTALALSMHTHLVAGAVWRHQHAQPAEALLRKIAAKELVLVSTGAGDWVESVGRAVTVEGGYSVTAVKGFGSGSPVGDLILTSAPHDDATRGPEVLVFAVPFDAKGVTVRDDWDALGMRGTGSCSIELAEVFVPEAAVSVRRPRGQWHPSWNVTITVAAPLYTAPYVGVAERAAELAREIVQKRVPEPLLIQALGEMDNSLVTMELAYREMVALANDLDFAPDTARANRMLICKTLVANAARATVDKAVEVVGGTALFRRTGLERAWRDVQGAPFHPLTEKKQLDFSGRVALGLPPVGPLPLVGPVLPPK